MKRIEATLEELAVMIRGSVKGDKQKVIRGVRGFEEAGQEEITYAAKADLLKRIESVKAGAVIVSEDFDSDKKNLLKTKNPRAAFAKVMNFFYPRKAPIPGISKNTSIGKNFIKGTDVFIGPFAAIGDNVTIGNSVAIHSGVVICDNVKIGNNVEIFPNVSIMNRCKIGSRVTIHPNTVIGGDGFGFAIDSQHIKMPHIGTVQIDDDVEIGSCNTIDRALLGSTRICSGVKTDNQVHIGHNVTVGKNSLIVAGVRIGGSVTIGKNVIIAGQAGIAQHLTIGDNSIVGPQAGVARSVPAGQIVSGSTEMPHKTWLRVQNIIPRLPEFIKRILKLEKQLLMIKNQDKTE